MFFLHGEGIAKWEAPDHIGLDRDLPTLRKFLRKQDVEIRYKISRLAKELALACQIKKEGKKDWYKSFELQTIIVCVQSRK